jgi:serine/threonine-protein kinase
MGFLKQHMFSAPPSPRRLAPDAGIPVEAEAVVLKALQKDPALRFQTMAGLCEALAAVGTGAAAVEVVAEGLETPSFVGRRMEFADGEVGPSRRRIGLGVGIGGVLMITVMAVLWGGREPQPEQPVAVAPPAPVVMPTPAPVPTKTSPTVTIEFVVTPDARVIDRRDGQAIGRTSDAGGLALPRSDTPRELLLVADGYEEEALVITPNADQKLERTLRRKKKRTGKQTGKADGVSLEPVNPFKQPAKKGKP